MKISIHGRNFKEETKPFIQELFDELKARKVDIQISETFSTFLNR
jgi:NAD+ kinase